MSKTRFLFFLMMLLFVGITSFYINGDEVVNIQYIGQHGDHFNFPIPADQPDVYYDDDEQEIIIDNTSRITLCDASPSSTIMLNKHNYIPYMAPLLLQNTNICKSQYVIADEVTAGKDVNSNRTFGGVSIKNGIQYEIEASGNVSLYDGFSVEKGATFAVYPSSF